MKYNMNKKIYIFVFIFSIFGFLYCVSTAIMHAWLGATPNYPVDKAEINFIYWAIGSAVSLLISLLFLYKIIKNKKGSLQKTVRKIR